MIFQPTKTARLWDTWMVLHQDIHHLFYLAHDGSSDTRRYNCIALATSEDGVHYEDRGPVVRKRAQRGGMGTGFTWKVGDTFYMDFSEPPSARDGIHFARSKDLLNWERLGPEYDCCADPRWYITDTPERKRPFGRWDHIYAIERPDGGYVGYCVGKPHLVRPGIEYESVGKAESDDGIHWRSAPPPEIDWGDWPALNLGEVAAIEPIDGRYYLLVGGKLFKLGYRQMSHISGAREGYNVYVADSPDGPFRPDTGGFRLLDSCNNSTHFPRFYRTPDDLLLCHHSIDRPRRYWHNTAHHENAQVWFPPVKRVRCDTQGHLHLDWWPANAALKGSPITIDLSAGEVRYPPPSQCLRGEWALRSDCWDADEPLGAGLLELPVTFPAEGGFLIECRAAITPAEERWAALGFYIETEKEYSDSDLDGVAVLLSTRGVTEAGDFILNHPYYGGSFNTFDTTHRGITPVEEHHLRLLLRNGMIELYRDNELTQALTLPGKATGTLGLVFESGRAVFRDVRAWRFAP